MGVQQFLLVWAVEAVAGVLAILPALAALTAVELLFPRERQSALSRYRAGVFWGIATVAGALVAVGLMFWRSAIPIPPHVTLDLTGLPLPWLTGPLVAAVLGDLAFYWMHRFQHRFLWRLHKVHHAIEEMNAVASYHHISESVVRAVFITLPGAVLITRVEPAAALGALVTFQGFYLHSCTRLHLGPLRWIIGDNIFHRVHHSLDPRHFDKNFSGFSPIWDLLFGTAYFPKSQEWPRTGIAERREAATMVEYIAMPFARSKDAIKADDGTGGEISGGQRHVDLRHGSRVDPPCRANPGK